MSALPSELVGKASDEQHFGWPARTIGVCGRQPALRLVTSRRPATAGTDAGRPQGAGRHWTAASAGQLRRAVRSELSAPGSGGPISAGQSWPGPLRLTRRGRVVVTAMMAALATAVIATTALAAGSSAQAANRGKNGSGYQGMHQIVVQPGDTLWSIASRAEPSQDPRLVMTQIENANSLSTDEVQAGQVLWVPE